MMSPGSKPNDVPRLMYLLPDMQSTCAIGKGGWNRTRFGRDLRHLVNLVDQLTKRNIGLKVLASEGASIDTSTANGRIVFGILSSLAEFERALLIARTKAGLAKLRLAQAAMGKPETKVADLCFELGIARQTLYRFVDPK